MAGTGAGQEFRRTANIRHLTVDARWVRVRSKEATPGAQLKCVGEIKAGDTVREAPAPGTCLANHDGVPRFRQARMRW